MSKFTFINEYDSGSYNWSDVYPDAKITVEFETEFLQAVINQFECFLRASGFVFKGNLQVVDCESCGQCCDEDEDDSNDLEDFEDDGSNIPQADFSNSYYCGQFHKDKDPYEDYLDFYTSKEVTNKHSNK